jgi:predicted nucleic acid-binding protein
MPVVVADTGPLRYLVLIEAIDLLPKLFGRVLIPEIVSAELNRPSTPSPVRAWLATTPNWLERRSISPTAETFPTRLDAGERAAIELAQAMNAGLLLIDDRAGIAEARARGLEATGTLGVLVRAAQLGLVDLSGAFSRLKATNFRYRPELLDKLLAQHRKQE